MGLRINTSSGILTTLRNLQEARGSQTQAQERLSSGLAINQASDDPSGLVISETLRSDLRGINQAIENTERASSLINTADAPLQEVTNQINNIRDAALEASNSALGSSAQEALQDQVDQSLQAIDRISSSSRFGNANLLQGDLSFQVNNQEDQIEDVRVRSIENDLPANVDVQVLSPATRAEAQGEIADTQNEASEVRIEGEDGSETFNFEAGATQADVEEAINSASERTGVEAQDGQIRSVRQGSEAEVTIEEIEGDLEGVSEGSEVGTDIEATVNGQQATGDRNTVRSSGTVGAEIEFAQDTDAGNFEFAVEGGGARFQVGPEPDNGDRVQIGIDSVEPSNLGDRAEGDTLDTLRTGGANALAQNPGSAIDIANQARDQVTSLRQQLGNVQDTTLESSRESLQEEIMNLEESESQIRDANIAEVAAENVRSSILAQSNVQTLQSINFNQGGLLDLLGGSL